MLEELEKILKKVLKNGFSNDVLNQLQQVEVSNVGIYETIRQKKEKLIKEKNEFEVLGLLQLIYAINVTLNTISPSNMLNKKEIETLDNRGVYIDGINNILKLTLNKEEDLSAQKLLSKVVNNPDYYYGEDKYVGNKKVYTELISRYKKAMEARDYCRVEDIIKEYKGDIVKYILATYDFTDSKVKSGKLLILCAKYYPEEVSKICFDLLNSNIKTVLRKYINIALGLNPQNAKFLYDNILELTSTKKIEKLKDNPEFESLYLGLLLTQSDYFKQFCESLNRRSNFESLKQIKKEYLDLCTDEGNVNKLRLYSEVEYEELYMHMYTEGGLYTALPQDLRKIKWDEAIEISLSTPKASLLYILEKVMLYSSKENRNTYLKQILNGLEKGTISSNFKMVKFYLYNKEIFKIDSYEIQILNYIWDNIFNYFNKNYEDRAYIDELAHLYRLGKLRENIKQISFFQDILKLKNSPNNEIVNITNENFRRDINFSMKKLYLDDSLTKAELNEVQTLEIRLNKVEIEDESIKHLVNLKSFKLECDTIKGVSKLNNCLNLEEVYLRQYNGTFDLECLNDLNEIKVLEINLEKTKKVEQVEFAKYKEKLKKLKVKKFDYEKHKILLQTFVNIEEFSIVDFEQDLIAMDENLTYERILEIKKLKNIKYFTICGTKIVLDVSSKKAEEFIIDQELENVDVNWYLLRENFEEVKSINIKSPYWTSYLSGKLNLDAEVKLFTRFKELNTLNVEIASEFPYILNEIDEYEKLNDFDIKSRKYRVKAKDYKKEQQFDYLAMVAIGYFSKKEINKMLEAVINKKIKKFELLIIKGPLVIKGEVLEDVQDVLEEIKKLNITSEVVVTYEGEYENEDELKKITEESLSSWNIKSKKVII